MEGEQLQGDRSHQPRRAPEHIPRWVVKAMALFVAMLGGLVVLGWLVERLRGLLVMLLISVFLSLALEPAVNRLERMGVRRGLGTGLVFLALLAGSGVFAFAIGAALSSQLQSFIDEAPGYIADIEEWTNDTFGIELDTDQLVAEFREGGAATRLATYLAGNLVGLGTTVLNLLFQLLAIGLFTFYLIADGPRLRRAVCSLLPPQRQRQVLTVWDLAIEKTGGYIYSRGLLALISFIFHWIVFSIIGIPFPAPLAMWVGLISQFIPVVGTYIAGALPILIALLDDPTSGLWVAIVVFAYQQIENYLLVPPITAHTMEMHPAVAFGAVIAGGSILGPAGALLALPAAATGQAFVSSLVQHHDVVDDDLTRDVYGESHQREKDAKRRRRWRRRSSTSGE
ncbi:MAG: AI-2E family transporter [Acidimicrobiales bacterium]|nr:AI-2E family transporter [Acidimicrobiales bacterium]